MTSVTIEEASTRLADLIRAAREGEEVVISNGGEAAVTLVPCATARPQLKFGSARGKMTMSDDFDEPLDDFAEYM